MPSSAAPPEGSAGVGFADMRRKADLRQRQLAAEKLTVRCSDCPWSFEGAADDGLSRHRQHRVTEHGRPESSGIRWLDEPPRRKRDAAPQAEKEQPPSLRARALALLRERGESTAAQIAAELGERTGSVSSALAWSRRSGAVELRTSPCPREKAKLWRIAGSDPKPDPEVAERQASLSARVAEALRASGRPMTLKELAAATGGPYDQITKACATALEAGEPVERVSRGVDRLESDVR